MRHFTFITLVVLSGSCAQPDFIAKTRTGQPIPIDTLNLMAVMIGPMGQFLLPISDAIIFHFKTNSIANEIIREEEKRIEIFKENLVATLSEKLGIVVRTSNQLEHDGVDAYRVESSIPAKNDYFPLVIFANGDLNFHSYGRMQNLRNEINTNKYLSENIAVFAEKFNLSNVAISYTRLAITDIGSYGISADLRMETYLLIFDRRGVIAIEATGILMPTRISGNALGDYAGELDKYKMMHNLLAIPLSKIIMK